MRTIEYKDWCNRGKELYGKGVDWKFRCPACGHIQSVRSIEKNTPTITREKIESMVHFSCEGRINKNFGCDWTLGGLLRMHELEIKMEDGAMRMAFAFADDPIEERKGI